MNGLCIASHLGLGDHIICNAIVRHYAQKESLVVVPTKYANLQSVAFMFRDLENVILRPVEEADDLLQFYNNVWDGKKLGLGCFDGPFNGQKWDREFFRQADLPYDLRWHGWKCKRDETIEINAVNTYPEISLADQWAFVHEDQRRGLVISKYHDIMPVTKIRPNHYLSPNLFAWWGIIEQAPIIHCISSSFALFIDSIELPLNPKLYLHAYARAGEPLAGFRKAWTILN